MRLPVSACLAAGAIVVALAGCGGSGDGGGGGDTGRELFAARCGGCHTLKSAGTSGRIGPSFDELKVTKAIVLATVREPPARCRPTS